MTVVPVGVDHTVFRPCEDVTPQPGRIMVTSSSDVPMKGLVPLLEAVAKLRTERDVELTVIGRPTEGGRVDRAIARLGLADAVHCVSGISDDALARLYGEAEVAVVPSLYEGFSLPAIEAMSCGVAVVATTGGALPEVVGSDGETGLLVPPDDPGALAGAIARLLDDPGLRARLGAAGRERVVSRFTWQVTAAGTAACYQAMLEGRPLPGAPTHLHGLLRGLEPVLTVDYDRLGVGPGDLVLDLGCGFGRHAFEAARRGASVVALDAGPDEVAQVRATLGAMVEAGELAPDHPATAVQGDALALPFADGTFDRVIASEVLEHIPDDVGRHARAGPGPQARRRHGGDGAALRARGGQLGALGRVPRHAGRPRPHLPALDAGAPAGLGRARAHGLSTTPTGCTRLTGGCAASSGRPTTRTRPSRRTTRCWCGTSSRPRSSRVRPTGC